MVPMLGQFHCMLEAASVAKSNKHNAKVGDLGQRLRLAWKHSCLIDERAGAYIGMKVQCRRTRETEGTGFGELGSRVRGGECVLRVVVGVRDFRVLMIQGACRASSSPHP